MAADVKEMYHMLRLPDHDKPAMRFLWRNSLREEAIVYQFERAVLEKCLHHPERTIL